MQPYFGRAIIDNELKPKAPKAKPSRPGQGYGYACAMAMAMPVTVHLQTDHGHATTASY